MQSGQLGLSDVRVSPVIFGAWAIGGWMWGGNDDNDALAAIRAGIDHGVNTIDTARVYGMGHSECLVGRAIKGIRDKVVIATKGGRRWDTTHGSKPWNTTDRDGKPVTIRSDSRPEGLVEECEVSLRNLGIETIDLYQVHWPDQSVPIETTMEGLAKLQKQGKIRAVGVSNYDLPLLKDASSALKRHGTVLASHQPPYSLIQRQIERDVIPWCRENRVGIICYSPMERGLLTGSITPERTFAPGDHRAAQPFFTPDNRRRVLQSLEKIRPIADRHGATLAQIVINWTFSQPGITAALVGARNAEQAAQNAAALNFTLTPQELTLIREAFDETSRVLTAA